MWPGPIYRFFKDYCLSSFKYTIIINHQKPWKKNEKIFQGPFFFLFSNYYKSNIFFLNFTKLIKLIKLNIYRKKKKKKIQGPKESIHLTHPGSILGSSLFLWDSVVKDPWCVLLGFNIWRQCSGKSSLTATLFGIYILCYVYGIVVHLKHPLRTCPSD